MTMIRKDEQGVALVITLFLMGAMSALAVSMMFLAQTETSASRNYRTMSQARYAGEAGVHRALHYLSSTAYAPTVSGMDTTVSPVTYGGNPVVLAPVAADSNHPDTATKTAYAALFTGASLSVGGGATVTYSATATLLSARSVTVYGGASGIVQTWRINATGTVPGTLPATVEVAALLERDTTPTDTYAIFATGAGCGAINLGGGALTDSYDSTNMTLSGGVPVTQANSGSVGTNGNLTIGGQTTVNGNLDTPRTGVGNCNNGNITALSESGQASVSGDTIQLPQPKTYPDPVAPSPLPPTSSVSITSSSTCASFGLTLPAVCTGTAAAGFTLTANGATLSLGNVSVSSGVMITVAGGVSSTVTMNVNTFSMTGGSGIALASGTSLLMNVAGQGYGENDTVVDFEGQTFVNGSFDPSKFQILYGGEGTIKMTGGTSAAATVYAPNAEVTMGGGTDFYGSVLAKTFSAQSQVNIHYDRSLASKFFTLGQHVMSSFSWQKY